MGGSAVSIDIEKHPEKIPEMLAYTKGDDRVPVIVEGEKVQIGFDRNVFLKGGFLLHGGT